MKSLPLLTKSSKTATSRRFVRKASGSLLAAALLLGLGINHVFGQGAYYPQVVVTGGAPFAPNGTPITSSAELNFINDKLVALYPTKSLVAQTPIFPAVAAPTAAEYNDAVRAAAKDVADGIGPVGVTIQSLSTDVAKYLGGPVTAIGAVAEGVIASTVPGIPAKQALLESIGKAVALTNPGGIGGVPSKLNQVFKAAASNVDFVNGVGAILKSALDNSLEPVPGTPAASFLTPTVVNQLVADAIGQLASNGGPVATVAPIVQATIAAGALSSGTVLNSVGNLDAATLAVMAYNAGGVVTPAAMLGSVVGLAAGDATKEGAIAQGALRTGLVPAATVSGAMTTIYAQDLATTYGGLPANPALPWTMNTGSKAGIAAAAMVKYTGANTAPGITQFFTVYAGVLLPAQVQAVLEAAVGANQSQAVTIAKTSVGLGAPAALPEDVAFGAIKGALILDAGKVANAVITLPSVVADAGAGGRNNIAASSMAAAGAAGLADVSYNIGVGLRTKPLATNTSVMNAAQGAVPLADRYLSVISYLAGNNKTTVGLAGTAAPNTAAGLAAQTASNTLINGLVTGSILANYDKTYSALVGSGAPETTKGLLTAASLANSSDAVGALAAATLVGGAGAVPLDQLTTAAVNANRSKQLSLTLGAAVANGANNPAVNIQQFVGRHVLQNPSNIVDVATAATVVKAQFSHFIAHTVAFNAPTTVNTAVGTILQHSRITKANTLASETVVAARDPMGAGGRPAAIAAIAAGLTTGLRENRQLSGTDFKNSLYDTVYAIVNQVYSYGAYAPYQYNDATPVAPVFRQSNGGVGTFTLAKATGVAGAVTGFVAQMVAAGDHLNPLNADLANALRGAFLGSGGASNQLVVGQAAGQAFGWVSGAANAAAALGIPAAIANAMAGGPAPAALLNAVNFGFDEAAGGAGRPGAGAHGLRDNSGSLLYIPSGPYYNHKSAAGVPVSNIFTL